MGGVEPTSRLFEFAYATLSKTSFVAPFAIQAPSLSWLEVTRPTSGVVGSTPAAV